MISEYHNTLDLTLFGISLKANLAYGSIVIEASQTGDIFRLNIWVKVA